MASLQITPTVGKIHLDTQRGVYLLKASREEDTATRHVDGQEFREFLTLLEAIAFLLQFWAAAVPTVGSEAPTVAAQIGDPDTFKAWAAANM